MGFISWLTKIFNKKEAEQNKEETVEKVVESVNLLVEEKETKDPSKNKDFKKLLENLEENRESIIKSIEEKKPKIQEYEDRVEYTFKGTKFIFCKEGYDLFQKEFNGNDYDIIIDEGYLARQNKSTDSIDYFHRWLMSDDIKYFSNINECPVNDIHVHHADLTTTNNKKENLKPLTKEDHRKLHTREKFNGTNEEFENWYKDKTNS